MEWVLLTLKWVLVVLLALLMLLPIDALGRALFLRDKTRLDFIEYSKTEDSRVLFVYYPGILADGVKSSLKVSPVWAQSGDVLQVSYDGTKFSPNKVTKKVANWIGDHKGDYDTVVFIGSSMGGLLSYDTVPLIENQVADVRFILVDAPTKRSDFQAPLDKLSLGTWAWWAGPISNLLISKLYFKATFRGPAEENIEQEVDREELALRVKEAQSFPISTHNDWIRYIIGHEPLITGSLKGYPAIYLRSTRDHDTVRPEAYDVWAQAFGGELARMEVDSTHVGYNERPETWQVAFMEAIKRIGIS